MGVFDGKYNMPTVPINLIKGDKIGIETDYRDALPVNMYAVKKDILGAKGYMIGYPGLTKLADGYGADRGGTYNERFKNHYRVSGNKLISVSSDGVVSELGDIPGAKQARLSDLYSFNTQGIIADGRFFLYSPGVFQEVTDTDLGSPIDGVWVDQYYFMTDGEYLFHTELADETSVDPLMYATAEFMPDPSLGLAKTPDNKVLVFGRYSLEYFVNVATSNFAFSRIATRAQKIGIVATHAKCELGGGNFFITGGYRDGAVAVYAIGIGTATKVSTREIDKIISKYSEPELSDMRMECRIENDVTFVLVHLPEETLCFNVSVAAEFGKEIAWNVLKTGTGDTIYRAINGVLDARSSKWVYGDKLGTKIGILDNIVSTQYDEISEWLLFTPFINLETLSVDEISIETIPGHTTTFDAKVAFSITSNGVSYGSEHWMQYGEPNDYGQRFIQRRIGYCNDWIGFKFRGVSKSRMAFALMELTYA